jgi:hypothetical protein
MKKTAAATLVLATAAWLGLAAPVYAIPPGVEANGFTFGPAGCSDGVTRTFLHRRGLSTWSTSDGTQWKLLQLTIGGVTVFESGNSAGLDTVVDCAVGDEVSTIALVRE